LSFRAEVFGRAEVIYDGSHLNIKLPERGQDLNADDEYSYDQRQKSEKS